MLRSKIFTGILAMLLVGTCYSQNPWTQLTIVKMGFGVQSYTVDPIINGFRYEQVDDNPNNSGPIDYSSNNSFSYTWFPLQFENWGDHFYFTSNATGAISLLQDLNGYEQVGDGDTEAKRFELMPMRLGFGGWINNRVGLYAGVQYKYSRIAFSDNDVPDELILGGNQRGVHGVAVLNLDRWRVKGAFLYDWVRNSKKASKGRAQTIDLELNYALGENRKFGVWSAIEINSITSTGLSGKPTEDWNNAGIQNEGVEDFSYELPDISANSVYFQIGVSVMFSAD